MGSFLKNIHPLLRKSKGEGELENTNYAILNAIDTVLRDAETETIQAKDYSSLKRATGDYLDTWGTWFSIYRKDNEVDEDLRERIIEALDIPRGTNESIKLAIRRYLEDPTVGIAIYEPWKDIFYLNRSKLDSSANLIGNYYRYAVINVSIGVPFPEDLIRVIEDFKPSGVKLHLTYDPSLPSTDPNANNVINFRDLFAYQSETVIDTFNGYKVKIQGNLTLGEKTLKSLSESFITDKSHIGSFSRLTGNFGINRPYYHLVGVGSSYKPLMNDTLASLSKEVQEVEPDTYDKINTLDESYAKIPVGVSTELYMGYNLNQVFRDKHEELVKDKKLYSVIGKNNWITFSAKADIAGKVFRVQAFDFTKKEWVTLHSGYTTLKDNKKNVYVGDLTNYVNANQYLFLRIKTGGEYTLSLNYFSVDYTNELEVGYTINKPELSVLRAIGFEKVTMDNYIDKTQENTIYNDTFYVVREEDDE